MNKVKKIYYAHPISLYDTPQEERDLALIQMLWPDAEIYNPNSKLDQEKYKQYGMQWFYDRVSDCQLIVFRSFPDGKIGAGAWGELMHGVLDCAIPAMEIPFLLDSRSLSINDTMEYLKHAGKR